MFVVSVKNVFKANGANGFKGADIVYHENRYVVANALIQGFEHDSSSKNSWLTIHNLTSVK